MKVGNLVFVSLIGFLIPIWQGYAQEEIIHPPPANHPLDHMCNEFFGQMRQ